MDSPHDAGKCSLSSVVRKMQTETPVRSYLRPRGQRERRRRAESPGVRPSQQEPGRLKPACIPL